MATVWVLGSGFSRPLGGPMLNQLLSKPLQDEVLARYPGKTRLSDLSAQLVRVLYEEWKNDFREPDAEEFLDYLDGASASDGGQTRIRRLFDQARRGMND